MHENEDPVESENADDASHIVSLDEHVCEAERRSHEGHHVIGEKNQGLLEDRRRKRRAEELRPKRGKETTVLGEGWSEKGRIGGRTGKEEAEEEGRIEGRTGKEEAEEEGRI